MKFKCDRNTILKEVSIAQDIISSRNALSILSNVLIEADNNTLLIRATDLKVGFETRIPVEVTVPGTTTIFCEKLLGILRSLPDEQINFELDGERLKISPEIKKVKFQLKSIAADQYPEIKDINDEAYFEIPQKDFIEMISQTIFAVSDDETRYFMNGVYLENDEGNLIMVATDGRRLSFIKKNFDGVIGDFKGIIIPPKVLLLIRKLSSGEGNFFLAISDKNIFIKFDNQKISSNLIEGQFPNYHRVIPEKQEYEMIMDKNELSSALMRVSLLVENKSKRIYFALSEDVLTLSSEESEIGVAKEEIACKYNGPESSIALNYSYISDPLKVIKDEEVCIRYSEPNKAITILPSPETDYFHIVMPMQID
ncbi:MAG: DNA polymerase III subunit beta [Spirochaetales bacterium]|nr:DNA polymerase III subunit beta [Spirochaetales bacterium]